MTPGFLLHPRVFMLTPEWSGDGKCRAGEWEKNSAQVLSLFFFSIFIGVELLYNGVLVSAL